MTESLTDDRRREALLVFLIANKDKAVKAKEVAPSIGLNPDWSYVPVRNLVRSLNEKFAEQDRRQVIVDTPKGYIYTEDPVVVREAVELAEKDLEKATRDLADLRRSLVRVAGGSPQGRNLPTTGDSL